jgi:hypothetical protein
VKQRGLIQEIWHYRVIHKVYYDDDGEIWSCSEEPVRLEAESLESLREDLENYDYALELPWLEYRSIVPDYPEYDELEREVPF